jgi:hypothetical protein
MANKVGTNLAKAHLHLLAHLLHHKKYWKLSFYFRPAMFPSICHYSRNRPRQSGLSKSGGEAECVRSYPKAYGVEVEDHCLTSRNAVAQGEMAVHLYIPSKDDKKKKSVLVLLYS